MRPVLLPAADAMEPIYLDANASTPLLPPVLEAMTPYFLEASGNPASSHAAGRAARRALEDARERIAALLGAHPDEVVFTSGATEANNLALLGLPSDPQRPGMLASGLEHPCVLEPLQRLQAAGRPLEMVPVSSEGQVQLPRTLPEHVGLATLMLANHETGVLQPVAELADRGGAGVLLHCDAAAAVGKMGVSFRDLGVATLAACAHKFHGPKGIGLLLVRRGLRLRPLLHGGHQQQGTRPGTEPVPLAVGMARALELAVEALEGTRQHVLQLHGTFLQLLRQEVGPVVVNGGEDLGLPHTLNLSFPGCRAEGLLMALDLAGVQCSAGSACSSGSLQPSPVLRAMGLPEEQLRSALRFGFSRTTTLAEVVEGAQRIARCVKRLRHRSYED